MQLQNHVKRAGCGLAWLVTVAVAAVAVPSQAHPAVPATQAVPSEIPDEDASGLEMSMPAYPKDLAWQGIGGTVVLVVTIDERGGVADLQIEKSSGNRHLDKAALEGARAWRFRPAKRQGKPVLARVRVPVAFEIPPQYALDRITGRPRDAYFSRRREGAAPMPEANGAGLLPGFVIDVYPIGVESADAARRLLERYAFREADAVPGAVAEYTLRDEEGLSYWNIVQSPKFPHAVVRRRLAGNGEKSWFVSSILCEGAAVTCDGFRDYLQRTVPAQQPLPPLPALPPLPERK